MDALPLAGVRILDLSKGWSGPYATRLLADMGAEVIQQEAAHAWDVTRALSDLGVSIVTAHVSTFGERAVDVFYVKDAFGLKIEQAAKLKKSRDRLLEALAEPAKRPAKASTAA